jgi:hypothetical protein
MDRPLRFAFCLTVALASLVPAVKAGTLTATFEDLGLAPNSYLNAANPAPPGTPVPYETSGFFTSGGGSFHNVNGQDTFFPYWSGWSISTMTDTTTNAFDNQYSAITGKGAGGSATYAVADAGRSPTYINLAPGDSPLSFDVTNTTYTALTMQDGDPYGFTKAFSHALNSYFLLTITGYGGLDATGPQLGSLGVLLADFRDSDPSKNFILKSWETVFLPTAFANAESLGFVLTSSDNDPLYGMNTPAYFALDNLTVATPAAVPEPTSLMLCLSGVGIAGLAVRKAGKRSG